MPPYRVQWLDPTVPGALMTLDAPAKRPKWLTPGLNGQVLTIAGGVPAWAPAGAASLPITTLGDLIIGNASGVGVRLPIGAEGEILRVMPTGIPSWTPETDPGDPLPLGVAGALLRYTTQWEALAPGSVGQVLTMNGGPGWATPPTPPAPGMANPMTTAGDVIVGGASGTPTRLAPGTDAYVLTMLGGVPTWAVAPGSGGGMANPMTTLGDLIVGDSGGTPTRLPLGTFNYYLKATGSGVQWQPLPADVGFDNPMTAVGDLIFGWTAGQATRLAIGTTDRVLTVVGGQPAWAVLPVDPGFANPMTTLGDLVTGGASGAPGRLGVGTVNQVLTVVGGVPTWAEPTGMTNPMTAVGEMIVGGAGGVPTAFAAPSAYRVLQSVAASAFGWSQYIELTKIVASGASAANVARILVPGGNQLPRPAWTDQAANFVGWLSGVIARGGVGGIINSAAETTIATITLPANLLNGIAFGVRFRYQSIFLNNSGADRQFTVRIKLNGNVVATLLTTPVIPTNAAFRAVNFESELLFQAGGGTPPWNIQSSLRVANPGMDGTSVGTLTSNFSAGSSLAFTGIGTDIVLTFVMTVQLSVANANLQMHDQTYRMELL